MVLDQMRLNAIRDAIKGAIDEAERDTLADVLFILAFRGDVQIVLERLMRDE